MSKTLDSVRDKRFVQDTLKRVANASSPVAFFCVLKHAVDKKPVLLVGAPDAELKKVALLPASEIISGRCKKGDAGVEFYTDDTEDDMKFKEAIRKVSVDAGLTPLVAIRKPLSALGGSEDSGEDASLEDLTKSATATVQAAETIPSLTFSKDSWIKFSATWTKRSPELKAIDAAFDSVARAKNLGEQIKAASALSKVIKTWLDKKEGDSRRLAMVSTLKEEVTAHIAEIELKYLTNRAGEFKARFGGQLGDDIESEKAALGELMDEMSVICKSPAFHDSRCVKLADALQKAAATKKQELLDIGELREFQAARQPLLEGAILKPGTKRMIKDLAETGKSLESKELVDALFEDFCDYGRSNWKYDTKASKDSNLLGGAKTGACGTFSTQFAKLVNIIVGKKIAKYSEVSAKNFVTVPLKTVRFIDPACPGNLKLGEDAQPDRYFYTAHYITVASVGKYCPTTGTKDAAVDSVVDKQGFKNIQIDKKEAYELGNERITIEPNKGYGSGSLYTLTKV